ncbi:hypothetical protein EZ456_08750 [Pedobacter psychrodurus]|uniref:Lipoprotein n=1 Tax=Pedobacter psychrodurus TaxID=2530456 RepID=A0A4R0Q1W6_9SPHI|nr:hypothetical protein [Pedobacter psychrodurus]TCD27281.1 hypothetical protein EZ456_08750 [Pedobacter psychrodurus]
MKNSIVILLSYIFLITACNAQQPISKVKEGTIKVAGEKYLVEKPDDKRTQLINTKNIFTNKKLIAPNLPVGIRIKDYMKIDVNLITKICANVIPLETLRQLPNGMNDYLFISLKMSEKGYPIEMEFLVKNTSLITSSQLNLIEKELKNGQFRVTFKQGVERFLKDINYFELDIPVSYSDMLKAKRAN